MNTVTDNVECRYLIFIISLTTTAESYLSANNPAGSGYEPAVNQTDSGYVDCQDIQLSGEANSGVYTITVNNSQRVNVSCDMTTSGGGWLVFQRRQDGSVDFFRNWIDYVNGFGSPAGEYWLGLENIHQLTSANRYRLRIDMADFSGGTAYAEYDNFVVEDGSSKYTLSSLGQFNGTAGDALIAPWSCCGALNMAFATYDADHNLCASTYKGAWWYSGCHYGNLNGLYLNGPTYQFATGDVWFPWRGYFYALKTVEMKIKPINGRTTNGERSTSASSTATDLTTSASSTSSVQVVETSSNLPTEQTTTTMTSAITLAQTTTVLPTPSTADTTTRGRQSTVVTSTSFITMPMMSTGVHETSSVPLTTRDEGTSARSSPAVSATSTSVTSSSKRTSTSTFAFLKLPSEPADCIGPPPTKDHANKLVYRTSVGRTAVYTCNLGFQFSDGATSKSIFCQNGKWLPDNGQCIAVQCISNDVTMVAGQQMTDRCPVGSGFHSYNGLVVDVIKCVISGSSGVLSRSRIDCDGSACQPAPLVLNADARFDWRSRTVTYVCHPGFRFSNGFQHSSYSCLNDGNWNWDNIGRCLAIYCPPLRIPVNGKLSTTVVDYLTLVVVTCNDGFMFPDRNLTVVVQCVDSATILVWNDTVTDCIPVYCTDPPTIANGSQLNIQLPTTSTNRYIRGTIVTYGCSKEQRFEDGSDVKYVACNNIGLWNETQFTCDYNRCSPVPVINHGGTRTKLSIRGQTIEYTCDDGYAHQSKAISKISCDGNNWSTKPTDCSEIVCPALTIANANFSSNSSRFTFGSQVNVFCQDGFTVGGLGRGHVIVVCGDGGAWRPTNVACQPVDCGSPPLVNHATITTENFATTYPETLTFSCQRGYAFDRGVFAKTITCQKDGNWSSTDDLNCTVVTCLPLGVNYVVNSTSRTYQTPISYTCSGQQVMQSANESRRLSVSVCSSLGQWQPAVSECKELSERRKIEAVESEHSRTIGTVTSICVCSLFAIVFIADLPEIKKSFPRLLTFERN